MSTTLQAADLTRLINRDEQLSERNKLLDHFYDKLIVNHDLSRKLVSFQANKKEIFYSWFKFKEGFSIALIDYILKTLGKEKGVLLDPFVGAGAAIFASAAAGWEGVGVEVLPVGIYIMKARIAAEKIDPTLFHNAITMILSKDFTVKNYQQFSFQHLSITQGAFPEETERQMAGYLKKVHALNVDGNIKILLNFACFCILESISFTRKDGQYLRWDYRSGRSKGQKKFDKGRILSFREAIASKLNEINDDLHSSSKVEQLKLMESGATPKKINKKINIISGSCLYELPKLQAKSVDLVITSPPYCNRYDYTRTYALELAFLNQGNDEVKELRQTMLSCTVENRTKEDQLQEYYHKQKLGHIYEVVSEVFHSSHALKEVMQILNHHKLIGSINNPNIPKMVRNYFYEMCFVIYELSRLLKKAGVIVMVNDNVRYVGEEIPVDLILSEFAEAFGLNVKCIWVLPVGKGNSSQQMGRHGRTETRKCVYIWEKNE